jgi:putative membrane protein
MLKFLRLSLLTDDLFKRFVEKELNLNDQLAAIRSILASERTFLAYQRTALATLAAGFTLIQFFQSTEMIVVGWLLIPIAVFTLTIGFVRYRKTRKYIFQLEKDFVKNSHN